MSALMNKCLITIEIWLHRFLLHLNVNVLYADQARQLCQLNQILETVVVQSTLHNIEWGKFTSPKGGIL